MFTLVSEEVGIKVEFSSDFNEVVEQLNLMNEQISLEGLIDVDVQLFMCLSYKDDNRYDKKMINIVDRK